VIVPIALGEAALAAFAPQPVYAEGAIAIPYTLTNTGQLPVQFTTTVTVTRSTFEARHSTFDTYLPVGAATSGSLLFDLPAGDYTLTYATPFETGSASFRVLPPTGAELVAVVGPGADGIITVTANVTNTGFQSWSGDLRLETPFFSTAVPVTLSPGASGIYPIPLNTAAASPGVYSASLALLSGSGAEWLTYTLPITVTGPDLHVTRVPTATVLAVGQVHTLTLGVSNTGDMAGQATLRLSLGDIGDQAQTVWLESGGEADLRFRFYLPPSLEAKDYLATYVLSAAVLSAAVPSAAVPSAAVPSAMTGAERGDFLVAVQGISLTVESGWDESVYAPGDPATLRITVTNQAAEPTPPLYARVAYHGQVITQPLSLSGSATSSLSFALSAGFGAITDNKVSYGIYEASEQRGVYLNTAYLYLRYPDVTLVLDRQVYQPGETAHARVLANVTGTLAITAPGFSTILILGGDDTSFQFTLPAGLTRGTYSVDYALNNGLPRSIPFDVDAPWVRVTEARLLNTLYVPGDDVQADLTVASTARLPVAVQAWFLYPDGTRSAPVVYDSLLQASLNNHITVSLRLLTTQAGPHSLVYWLTDPADPDRVYASGLENLDVGAAVVLSLRTDRAEYLHTTEPVTAVVTLLATHATPARIEWQLDSASVTSQAVDLVTGTQTVALPVPVPLAPGRHIVQAKMVANGLSHTGETKFDYGTAGPDVVAGRPYLYEPAGFTTTVPVYVYNRGGEAAPTTTLRLYDGDPSAAGALIAQFTVPPLPAKDSASQHTEEFLATWDVTGRAGPHTLYAVADAGNIVQETNEANNMALAESQVPRLSLVAFTDKEMYERGEAVSITVRAANLQASGDLHLVLTTTADLLGFQPFQVVEPLTIPANTLVERQYTWKDTETRGGKYALVVKATGEMGTVQKTAGFSIPDAAEFVATPLIGTAPLTVTFTDLSSPWGQIDNWNWDFGDGSPAVTETNPVHVYQTPGHYTVTLTAVITEQVYTRVRPDYITVLGTVGAPT
jgi:hypothetical protein